MHRNIFYGVWLSDLIHKEEGKRNRRKRKRKRKLRRRHSRKRLIKTGSIYWLKLFLSSKFCKSSLL
jgi:uncharacterized protein (DUF2225 family)